MSLTPPLPSCSYEVGYVAETWTPLADDVLACVHFGGNRMDDGDPRRVRVPLEQFGAEPTMELWRSHMPVERGESDGFRYAHNGDVVFAQLWLDGAAIENLDHATARAYVHIDSLLQRLGYPGWLRMWNFLAHINQGDGDHERYRLFAQGRHRALALKPGFELQLPAATAIGGYGEGLLIYFLAARSPGIQAENPRQLSAFHYPPQYGRRSPSFSRATRKPWADAEHLFVSGTASVVGHATLHPDLPLLQLEESARNLQALLDSSGMAAAHPLGYKLFARNPADFDAARQRALELFGADAPLLCLHGDICRRDLLVEVEALYALDRRC